MPELFITAKIPSPTDGEGIFCRGKCMTKERFKYLTMLMMVIAHSQYLFTEGSTPQIALMIFNVAATFVPVAMTYFVVEGYYKTKSLKRYILRLSIAGIIAIPFQGYLIGIYGFTFLATLALCLIECLVFDKCKYIFIRIPVYICLFVIGDLLFEGGLTTLISALIFLLGKKKKISLLKIFSIIGIFYFIYDIVPMLIWEDNLLLIICCRIIETISAFCTYFIVKACENHIETAIVKRKSWHKYVPYIFYPTHFAILCTGRYAFFIFLLFVAICAFRQKIKDGITKGEIITIALLIILDIFFMKYIVLFTHILSASMEPTLCVGEYVVYNRLAYKNDEIKRGDIVSFQSDELDELVGKRVIGLPGDIIEFEKGNVIINGNELDETEYISSENRTYCEKSFKVPEGTVFLLGDNREVSYDSRYWDNPFIPIEDILGRYSMTLWHLQ